LTLEKLIESVVTGGTSPAEILKQLTSCGIEWHLTEKGDLMIKYWRVGAESFAPAEHVARLREGGKMYDETNALEWVSSHLSELRREYAGKWLAVVDGRVAAASDNLPALLQMLEAEGIERPFITEIPAQPIVWATAYAYQGI
jgi:hypothetical protein